MHQARAIARLALRRSTAPSMGAVRRCIYRPYKKSNILESAATVRIIHICALKLAPHRQRRVQTVRV
ncbi:hypothetical protein O988_05103 [Pseudogymnoascus sp. VKM F-3808]|nr:hypothetical protein O988_05103 [Pseudogymnoascus sp. VKM F-3808]